MKYTEEDNSACTCSLLSIHKGVPQDPLLFTINVNSPPPTFFLLLITLLDVAMLHFLLKLSYCCCLEFSASAKTYFSMQVRLK